MKRTAAAIALAFCLLPAALHAAERTPEQKAAEELLLLLQVDRNVEAMMENMAKMVPSALPKEGLSEEAAAAGKAYMEKVLALLKREMAWEKLKDRYVDVYAQTFTEAEMKEISDFYRTPIGRKFVERMPALMEKSMAIGQETAQRLLPEILKMAEEAAKEAKPGKGTKGR